MIDETKKSGNFFFYEMQQRMDDSFPPLLHQRTHYINSGRNYCSLRTPHLTLLIPSIPLGLIDPPSLETALNDKPKRTSERKTHFLINTRANGRKETIHRRERPSLNSILGDCNRFRRPIVSKIGKVENTDFDCSV